MTDNPKQLPSADTAVLQSGSDLAQQALAEADDKQLPSGSQAGMGGDDELAQSDQLADTLMHLQGIIERNAQQLERLKKEIKEKRESLRSVFENDTELSEAETQATQLVAQVKERKAKLKADPQVTSLNVQVGELKQQAREIEEALSNHLVNYYQLTNSKSFDTSEGDQWEFEVRAKVKGRGK